MYLYIKHNALLVIDINDSFLVYNTNFNLDNIVIKKINL